ncbi:pyruvate ferredoxin/flavodoxin oxidoreductase [Oscillatoria nigro-viridis PCC 7112]|uniref:Pyruvate-flavodoxin oxidoreductase n=1 Tax=Phormidium nigroviride PCC 7112 TaxID=179408 RepID=K9VDG6_9CYAN|nr:pyruvate:ferredoxin (flavodoxin) oxidoreductase [Oscillatoria nigro-viridis]AFZ05971.1 pyruvate ferredoxin/flavodoxin oxidoreductase [Oscillatoria nigro-viridis PCC 7112]
MPLKTFVTIDGNEAVARVAYRLSEVIAIYPITPASTMGEWADAWASAEQRNVWGTVPSVVEMQSEAGAAGTVHGALQAGTLTTTFTASQGLLLMIPNLYKIAGELTPAVIHIAARSLAAQGLSIFGDHSDVMAVRGTGCGLLCSASVQESQDLAAIATRATLESRIPFLHFFDGFRTSHEIQKVELLSDDELRAFIPNELILAHRDRALTPDRPVIRGTAQNPDVYFQARETVNRFYNACPDLVQQAMDEFAQLTGRQYQLYEYYGDPAAEQVIVLMGSGCETVHETVDYLNARGAKLGVLKVRLYRPFDGSRLVAALPESVKAIAVLDRAKEPGSTGEPLYLDVLSALVESNRHDIQVVGGRYGLSSKEFTPAMVKAVFDNLTADEPLNHFTVGIYDDVTHTSLNYDPSFSTEPDNVVRAIFYGLGADGTVGANKNSIKIIGEETDNYAQGYFVYDSKKSGSVTVSHLRFGPELIRSTYLVSSANFVACHQWEFVEKFDLLDAAKPEAIFLLNSPYNPEETWMRLPERLKAQIVEKQLKLYVINASQVARETGMSRHINTVMQVCFFAVAGVLPREEAIARIKQSIRKTYGKKGEAIVEMNLKAVDRTLDNLYEVDYQSYQQSPIPNQVGEAPSPVPDTAPAFVRDVLGKMMARQGDDLPVSALPIDGTYPSGTSKWEKRNIAQEIPVWDADVCVQCGKCVMMCPHAVIRSKVYEPEALENAPETFKSANAKDHDWTNLKFTIQVAAEDCTGCGICVDVCPAKNRAEPRKKAINMAPQLPLREQERENWDFFLSLPNPDRTQLKLHKIAQQQMQEPLFEFSGACAGCGETPYVKLVSQLFGDRMLVANATGCSSIYGGNLPTTPWTHNAEGRGPAWSNSLFEDNAEFGLGFRVAIDKQMEYARELLQELSSSMNGSSPIPVDLASAILNAEQKDEADIVEQRERVAILKQRLEEWCNQLEGEQTLKSQIQTLKSLADYLVKKSVWLIGGDGWAYDIGYGGLDHVLASGRNVNILVLDTEVYSNTGGQMSKATPRGAVAKFAAGGKPAPKKDLGLMAMTYGNVYVASVAMGARDEHTLKAFLEAESYNGPSLIIAYSHCIAHGIDMATGMQQQKAAVESGRWLLYRYDPRRTQRGENPLILDSRSPKISVEQAMYSENRFKMLTRTKPEDAKRLVELAQADVNTRWQMYQYLAAQHLGQPNGHHDGNSVPSNSDKQSEPANQ